MKVGEMKKVDDLFARQDFWRNDCQNLGNFGKTWLKAAKMHKFAKNYLGFSEIFWQANLGGFQKTHS